MRSRGPNYVFDIVPGEFLAGLITAEHVIDVLIIYFSTIPFCSMAKGVTEATRITNHFIHNSMVWSRRDDIPFTIRNIP
jgi:hypothetical protein